MKPSAAREQTDGASECNAEVYCTLCVEVHTDSLTLPEAPCKRCPSEVAIFTTVILVLLVLCFVLELGGFGVGAAARLSCYAVNVISCELLY